ncbi:MAG: hypothetical protein ACK53Y_12270, partial [bacterium]
LYIAPSSAHPPSCLKGIIHGELQRNGIQHPDPNDFKTILTKFITRLLERGYDIQNRTPILLQAVINIEHKTSNYKKKNNQKTLHIHWPFHPKGLQHQDIRQEYCKT